MYEKQYGTRMEACVWCSGGDDGCRYSECVSVDTLRRRLRVVALRLVHQSDGLGEELRGRSLNWFLVVAWCRSWM